MVMLVWLLGLAPIAASETIKANFNNDGFADLAIGVPAETVGDIAQAGAVQILYGSASGLSPTGNQLWHQNSPGIEGGAEEGGAYLRRRSFPLGPCHRVFPDH
jgi:hypothetical protein